MSDETQGPYGRWTVQPEPAFPPPRNNDGAQLPPLSPERQAMVDAGILRDLPATTTRMIIPEQTFAPSDRDTMFIPAYDGPDFRPRPYSEQWRDATGQARSRLTENVRDGWHTALRGDNPLNGMDIGWNTLGDVAILAVDAAARRGVKDLRSPGDPFEARDRRDRENEFPGWNR